jgi:hypothetical protein
MVDVLAAIFCDMRSPVLCSGDRVVLADRPFSPDVRSDYDMGISEDEIVVGRNYGDSALN